MIDSEHIISMLRLCWYSGMPQYNNHKDIVLWESSAFRLVSDSSKTRQIESVKSIHKDLSPIIYSTQYTFHFFLIDVHETVSISVIKKKFYRPVNQNQPKKNYAQSL